jgi:hypothetical protein
VKESFYCFILEQKLNEWIEMYPNLGECDGEIYSKLFYFQKYFFESMLVQIQTTCACFPINIMFWRFYVHDIKLSVIAKMI